MTSHRLRSNGIEKPWGRSDLPQHFDAGQSRIGEIWFENPSDMDYPLLVKMLYTSEKLSIQVHPDDAEARSMGFSGGLVTVLCRSLESLRLVQGDQRDDQA